MTTGLTIFGSITEAIIGTGGGVQSVSGLNTDNTDPANPMVQISVDGVTITGAGTPGSPLVSVGGGSQTPWLSNINADGYTLFGNDGAGESLTLASTSDATKGKILFGTSAYDEVLNYLGINTSNPNARLDVVTNGLGVTQTNASGIMIENSTAAAAGAQQISPRLMFRGSGWKTNATAASQTVDFSLDVLPVQGAAAPTGTLQIASSIAGGAYTNRLTIDTAGNVNAGASLTCNGSLYNSSTVTGSNIWVNSAQTATSTNATNLLFAGASAVSVRTAFNGTTNYSIAAGNPYGGVIIGGMPVTEASSGTHAVIANLVVNAMAITNAAGSTTNAATLYIPGAPTGITPTAGGPYALMVGSGDTRLVGNLYAEGAIASSLNSLTGSTGTRGITKAFSMRITYSRSFSCPSAVVLICLKVRYIDL